MAARLTPAGSTPSDFVIIYGDDMPPPPKQGMKILKTVANRLTPAGSTPSDFGTLYVGDMPPPARGCLLQRRRGSQEYIVSKSNHATPVSTDPDKPKISWTWTQTRHKSCTDRPPEDSTHQSARTSSSHYPSSHLYKHKQEPTS